MILTPEQAAALHLGVNVLVVSDPEPWRGHDGIVPLYTECSLAGTHVSHSPLRCPTRLVGRASIEVVPVVTVCDCLPEQWTRPFAAVVWSDRQALLMAHNAEAGTWASLGSLDPLPVPGRDWGILIDCVEVI